MGYLGTISLISGQHVIQVDTPSFSGKRTYIYGQEKEAWGLLPYWKNHTTPLYERNLSLGMYIVAYS